jgi:DNA-directed RNA polymerase subunit M/transcription elongation factor TFIIS
MDIILGGNKMICPQCGSENVTITMHQIGSETEKYGVGFDGHMNNLARGIVAVCTLGLSNLFWRKRTGSERAVMRTKKICLCQNCGHSWEIREKSESTLSEEEKHKIIRNGVISLALLIVIAGVVVQWIVGATNLRILYVAYVAAVIAGAKRVYDAIRALKNDGSGE